MTDDRCDYRVIHIEKVREAKESALEEKELEKLSQFFKTFSDPNR